jgi:4,5-dihydroxyphthalate decarboxylase
LSAWQRFFIVTDQVNVVGGDYEHTLGLESTRSNIEFRYSSAPLASVFFKMLRERCYEACEFSLANYLMLHDRGEDWLQAVPIFPYRAFRHSTLQVRTNSDLCSPRDLRNKRVGVPDFSMTAAVWTRGILREFYGVDWREIRWTVATPQRFSNLADVGLDQIDGDLEEALMEGRLDALLTTKTKDEQSPVGQRQLRTLIPDVDKVEQEYLAVTGIYPINHVVVMRSDVVTRLPELPEALMEAYEAAKQAAYKRRLGATLVPWGSLQWRRMFDLFGEDPMPYGLTPQNILTLQTFGRYLREQRLVADEPDLMTLFREK